MKEVPEDWVLLEAARRCAMVTKDVETLREFHAEGSGFDSYRALCDMIAKYEQPLVDPDVEAVKRVLKAFYNHSRIMLCPDDVTRAVAQYKLERAK